MAHKTTVERLDAGERVQWPVEVIYGANDTLIDDAATLTRSLDTLVAVRNQYGHIVRHVTLDEARRAILADWPVTVQWQA